ncbi:DUF885 domain-containing protein [Granulicella tundricola]|uniref:DUF885 domain-containing protein n=1 Tax=Granulicella tundricola (strain ATCC BAA-1859 / DSM 23138 / MP5ACTX9) TaxID=1198114 RepID=E8WWU5_GRATM|nr:DUF885 domain-containing protein [Granulicella tundricola]ADW67423.1 protein of unknown function DUF885 [Granulicella tundricola MP5ACTX9]
MRHLPRIILLAAAATATLFPTLAPAQRVSADGSPQTFTFLANNFLSEALYPFSPTAGTGAGLHEYDTRLEDYSPATIAKQIAIYRSYEKKISAIDGSALDAPVAADREILLSSIRSTLLTLETIRPFATNPDNYSSGITASAFSIMERPYAPANTRLRALVEREKLMPALLQEARTNLKNPPHIYTEIAIEQVDGNISFFQNDVPSAFADATDPEVKAAFAKSNAAVIAALKDYAAWMKSDLLPRSNGDYKLGTDTYRKKLAYDEMVDIPLDRLLEIATADLHKNQAEFARIAKEIDPSKTPQQVLAELATIHPAPDQLLNTFRDQFSSLIAFINTHHIITIPSKVEPTLEETPPFMRATTQASMDPPGPFETHSTKAYFNVTLPEKDWTPAHIAEHMAAFNVGTVTSTAVHEAYPGHYVQFLWMPQFSSPIRKVFGASTNIEGWAHYCEQMMLDEGYLPPGTVAGSKEAKLIRLGQLQDALLRDARFVVSIRLHTGVGGALTIAQAAELFVKEGYQSPSIGMIETKRGTSDAMYLYYTLGKLQIMKLRADLQAQQGSSFSLQAFHDSLMRQGFAPIKVVRKAMLHNDSPTL